MMNFPWWYWALLGASMLFSRWRGVGWFGAFLGGAFIVFVAPIGYFAGLSNYNHIKLLKEMNSAVAASSDSTEARDKVIAILDAQHIEGLKAKNSVRSERVKDKAGIRVQYEDLKHLGSNMNVVVSFDDVITGKGLTGE